MANEIAKRDANDNEVILGLTSASEVRNIQVDDVGRLEVVLVSGTATIGTASVQQIGYATIGTGSASIVTAGTRVQLATQPTKRVIIQVHGDGTAVTIGDSSVVATAVARRGITLFSTQSQVFYVNNLNQLYIDSDYNGDKIQFYFEN